MTKRLHKYLPFIQAGGQEVLAYRTNFYLRLISQSLGAFVTYFLWQSIFLSANHPSLNGFTLPQMVFYVFLSFFTSLITSSGGNWSIGDEVKDGSIAMRLLKPVSFSGTYLFQELGEKMMTLGLVAIPFIIGLVLFQIFNPAAGVFNVGNILLYLISSLFAYLLNFYFNICFGFTAFIFKNLWGSNMMKNSIIAFMSGALIPIAFFPHDIAVVLQFFPFASLIYTPVMIGMGLYRGSQFLMVIFLQVFWLLFFFVLEKIIWRVTIIRLNIQGG